jgi:hypothetical protein
VFAVFGSKEKQFQIAGKHGLKNQVANSQGLTIFAVRTNIPCWRLPLAM